MGLINEAIAWSKGVTGEGMPHAEQIKEVEMGLKAPEPVWHSSGLTGFANALNADEQKTEALHTCLATEQAGQVEETEDEAAAQQRTEEFAAAVQYQMTDNWPRLAKFESAVLLSASRGISYSDAKRMVHRRNDYERLGRLDELTGSLYTDPLLRKLKPTAASRQRKNEKPAAKAFLRKRTAAQAASGLPQSSPSQHQRFR